MSTLDDRILAAHTNRDLGSLWQLYAEAGDTSDPDASAFYLTHAYVFALEAGAPEAETIRMRLAAMGREPEAQGARTYPTNAFSTT